MPELIPILKKNEIDEIVTAVANKISHDYQGRELVLVGILKGAFVFMADLIRHLTIPVQVDFLGASSYGDETSTSGTIRLTKEIGIDIKDKDVLIVEDIIDTGLTLNHIVDHLKSLGPKTVRICALIDKQERRETEVSIAYAGHILKQGFLVGYGLDYAEDYRYLPEINHLKL